MMQKKLTKEDKKKLDARSISKDISLSIFVIIFSFIYYKIVTSYIDVSNFGYIPMSIFCFLIACFIAYIFYKTYKSTQKLTTEMKDCFEGIVTHKRSYIPKKILSLKRLKQNSKAVDIHHYLVTINGAEYIVKKEIYNDINVGDRIYFETISKSLMILNYEVLEKATSQIETPTTPKHIHPEVVIEEVPLEKHDYDNLRIYFKKVTPRHLFLSVIITFIITVFFVYNIAFLLFFAFLIPLIAIRVLSGLYKMYKTKKKVLNLRKKKRITTHVTNKGLNKDYNTNKHFKYIITTTYELVFIHKEVYENIKVGDTIDIYQIEHNLFILGVSLNDIYYPNYSFFKMHSSLL